MQPLPAPSASTSLHPRTGQTASPRRPPQQRGIPRLDRRNGCRFAAGRASAHCRCTLLARSARLSLAIVSGYAPHWEVSMDEQRNGERRIREVTREAFLRDGSDALRYAREDGEVLITKADGKPYAIISAPREPLDFDLD